MNLLECDGKKLLEKYSITIPKGYIIESADEITTLEPLVLKAQIPVGGRGKAGGIKVAQFYEQAKKLAEDLLSKSIKGYKVKKLLVEEKLAIQKEFYISIVLDRSVGLPIAIVSEYGGIDIENVPEEHLCKFKINPLIGLQEYMLRKIALVHKNLIEIAKNLWQLFINEDCILAEINPLVLTQDNKFVACDARIIIDDDALYRHTIEKQEFADALENEAKEKDIALVRLDGNIGVIANGAGLTMATLDMISFEGGKPGIFLDLGGGASETRVLEALNLILKANLKVILINVFGGITRCDDIALALKQFLQNNKIPLVVRLKGTKEQEAKEIIKSCNLPVVESFEDAVKITVALTNK